MNRLKKPNNSFILEAGASTEIFSYNKESQEPEVLLFTVREVVESHLSQVKEEFVKNPLLAGKRLELVKFILECNNELASFIDPCLLYLNFITKYPHLKF